MSKFGKLLNEADLAPKGVIVSGNISRLNQLPSDTVKGTKIPPISTFADYRTYPGYAETVAAGFKFSSHKERESGSFPDRDYVIVSLSYVFSNKKKQFVTLARTLMFYSLTIDGNYYGYHLKEDEYIMGVDDDNKKIRRDLSYAKGSNLTPAKIKTLLKQFSP